MLALFTPDNRVCGRIDTNAIWRSREGKGWNFNWAVVFFWEFVFWEFVFRKVVLRLRLRLRFVFFLAFSPYDLHITPQY